MKDEEIQAVHWVKHEDKPNPLSKKWEPVLLPCSKTDCILNKPPMGCGMVAAQKFKRHHITGLRLWKQLFPKEEETNSNAAGENKPDSNANAEDETK